MSGSPPTTEECAELLARVSASLLGWAPDRDGARIDARDACAVLLVLVPVPWPTPRYSELYESTIDAGEAVALVRDTLTARERVGPRRDLIRAACALLRAAIRGHVAQRVDRSVAHGDVSAADGAAVREAHHARQ